jgi:hypothetical protein
MDLNSILIKKKYFMELVKNYDSDIISKYDELLSQSKNLFQSLPDMEILAVLLICPKYMIDYIREENKD